MMSSGGNTSCSVMVVAAALGVPANNCSRRYAPRPYDFRCRADHPDYKSIAAEAPKRNQLDCDGR